MGLTLAILETKKVWVTSCTTDPMHGKIYVEKSPKYVFTKWHKDQNGEESKMNLKLPGKLTILIPRQKKIRNA